ncbi:MAG TPA: 50S ribosomal protein L32 [Candidatus Paceibacterota bacterium]|nr:50S ribosomal protein L32 [Candidatus Paceibacterota bacterium]
MRHTRAHTANRRSHHGLKVARFVACKDCGTQHLMHRVCLKCGKYRGRLVVDVLKKTVKAAKKAEARKEAKKEAAKPETKKRGATK